jgi:hypothetical protein
MLADFVGFLRRLIVGLGISTLLGLGAGQVRMHAEDECKCVQCSCVQLCCDLSNCTGAGTCDMNRDGCGYWCEDGQDDYFACSDYCREE